MTVPSGSSTLITRPRASNLRSIASAASRAGAGVAAQSMSASTSTDTRRSLSSARPS
jgi:hypothetical protein